ncbi:MAG TPA: hypothetical protein VGQ35_20715 [Dongiaceae bacterium]|nr:hypothetical protein [Dongiaceae bacterium]
MKRRRVLWTGALAALCALLIGHFALQSGADQTVMRYPNDKANHHPKLGDDPTN